MVVFWFKTNTPYDDSCSSKFMLEQVYYNGVTK